jgi:hypothetical protein
MTCSLCGSPHMFPIELYGPTGVTSPDGGLEYRLQTGYRCRACGCVEEVDCVHQQSGERGLLGFRPLRERWLDPGARAPGESG